MIALVTLSAAKRHLNIELNDTSRDEDIYSKIQMASELVMNFYKSETVPVDWQLGTSPQTYAIPQWAQAATLLAVGDLFYNRESGVSNVLPEAVRNLIPRTPTLA